ncbi:MAG TPA: hypothetical protein PLC19_06555 [Marmoricola sp.]|nr:hypothetical protein [Marmoricola sp.]
MPELRIMIHRSLVGLTAGLLLVGLGSVLPAQAAARVTINNGAGGSAIDPTYATTLTLSGRGFQSIARAHGGIYVMFGAVKGNWRPSQGGQSGRNYFTVPDSEQANNAGYVKFVAFPGSDTSGSANGGVLRADGSWSTTLKVPGAVFKTYDRAGRVTTVDCRKTTCGVLTMGAHGVNNPRNETFSPVSVKSLNGAETPTTTAQTPAAATESAAVAAPQAAPVTGSKPAAAPTLTVDRASAHAGRVLTFSATGLAPASQVSATFADGLVAVGPLTVGGNGQVAGMVQLPADLSTGTYEIRLVGEGELPSARFAVVGKKQPTNGLSRWASYAFAGAGALALVFALGFAMVRRRRLNRAH